MRGLLKLPLLSCMHLASEKRFAHVNHWESNYFNPLFIAQPSPNRRHRTGGDENLLALEGWPLGSSKSEKGQVADRR